MAFLYSFFLKSGYKPPNLKVSFRGADFSKLNDNDYWINNPHHYEINFSPFHLSELTVKSYVKKLNELKPKFLHGYPSAFISLAKHIQESGLNLNFKPKCIFLISEGYDLKDINFIKEFFKTNISSFYGLSERVVFAVADSNLENYIVDTNYGYFELIDSSGNIIETENVTGEIVATSYDNYAMPLIRYKTGDFTSYVNFKNKIFRKISGKWGQEFLYGVNKEEISLTALNLHSEQLDDVLKLQFIQHGLGDIEVLIMFKSQKDRLFISGIESFLSKRVGNKIRFNLNQTNNFIKTHRGKIPMIISKLEIK